MLILHVLVGCVFSTPTDEPPHPLPASAHQGPQGAQIVASQGLAADLAATSTFLDGRPMVERPLRVTGLEGVEGVGSLSAQACGACHPAIFEEWQASIHSQAWIDPQFQGEIRKSDNRWLCLNCHTPLLVQHDRWPQGLVNGDVEQPVLTTNQAFDPALREEGITCTACHLNGSRIVGPGLSDSQAPHPVEPSPAFEGSRLCISCHQATQTYEGKGFICVFETGEEWRDGPYDDEGKDCVSCHMPEVVRPAAVGGPVRTVRRHWWKGSGIPKIAGRYPPPEANVPGLGLNARQVRRRLVVEASNAAAGHKLPSGDPERWVQIDVTFEQKDGGPVGTPFQHRIGQIWEWGVPPRKVSDNRLAPRSSRALEVPIPRDAVAARITGSSHRISEENARYHGLEDYPRSVVTHQLRVPVNLSTDVP